jgi:soluble lytic murein transglycosylase-like protein
VKKTLLILIAVSLITTLTFSQSLFSYTNSEDTKQDLKFKTFLTDYVSSQYKIASGKDLAPERLYDIIDGIMNASKTFEISPLLIAAIIDTETNFRNIIGSYGEVGYMQLRPTTAKYVIDMYPEIFKNAGYDDFTVDWIQKRLLIDPQYNILVGTAYLKHLMNNHEEDIYKAVGWYNGGGNEYYAKKVIYKIAEISVSYPTI